jgi:hypothetical protein
MSTIHTNLHKPNNKFVGAQTNHGHTQTHKIHHDLNLRETTTFPFIVFSMLSHRGCTQMSFCLGTPKSRVLKFSKFPKLGFLRFWRSIIFYADLRLKWGLNQSCSLCQELFKYMWHATCTQLNQGDFWLLVVETKLALWLMALLLAITCVFNTQMGHVNPFKTFTFQELSMV